MANAFQNSLTFAVRKLVPAGILLALGVGTFLLLWFSKKPAATVESGSQMQTVTVTTTAHYDGPIYIEANGLVVPHKEIIMAAEVAGKIAKKNDSCRSGHWVPAGTELMSFDARDFEITISRLKAELRQAETQLNELLAEIQNADALLKLSQKTLNLQQREYDRLERLRGNVSASEIDKAGLNLNQAENAFLTQKHQLNLLTTRQARLDAGKELVELQLEQAHLDLKRTRIVAPSDGVIVSEEIEEGSYVQPGTQLLIFEDTTRSEIEFNLTVNELYWIMLDKKSLGLPDESEDGSYFRLPRIDNVEIEFGVDGLDITWSGHLDGFAKHGVNEQTRNVPCRVIVDQPHAGKGDNDFMKLSGGLKSLRRGMFVRVIIPVEPSVPLIRFPEQALSASNRVWVVRNETLQGFEVKVAGRLDEDQVGDHDAEFVANDSEYRPSSSQIKPNDRWVIALNSETGVRNGDRVVDSPLTLPYDGMRINVSTPEPPPSPESAQNIGLETPPAS